MRPAFEDDDLALLAQPAGAGGSTRATGHATDYDYSLSLHFREAKAAISRSLRLGPSRRLARCGAVVDALAGQRIQEGNQIGFLFRSQLQAELQVRHCAHGFVQRRGLALQCAAESGLPAIATLSFRPLITSTSDGHSPAECARVMTDLGAVAVGANCEQDPARMLPLLRAMRGAIRAFAAPPGELTEAHQRKTAAPMFLGGCAGMQGCLHPVYTQLQAAS